MSVAKLTRAQAKREAWWRAAGFVRAAMSGGYDFEELYGSEGPAVETAMMEVIRHMERSGRK